MKIVVNLSMKEEILFDRLKRNKYPKLSNQSVVKHLIEEDYKASKFPTIAKKYEGNVMKLETESEEDSNTITGTE